MVFPRQEYQSGLPFPSPGDLPDPGIEPASPTLLGGFFTAEPPRKPKVLLLLLLIKRQVFLFFADNIEILHLWLQKNIMNLIEIETSGDVHVYSSLLCCWKMVFAITSMFSWQNSVSL